MPRSGELEGTRFSPFNRAGAAGWRMVETLFSVLPELELSVPAGASRYVVNASKLASRNIWLAQLEHLAGPAGTSE